jgi:Protein of unknown function (DUF3768)
MPRRQAKTLSSADVNDLLVFASCTRNPLRNRVVVLLSAKAGLRAGEDRSKLMATRMFKIDYFDRELSMHSPDPADPSVTQRVITIMLAEEY